MGLPGFAVHPLATAAAVALGLGSLAATAQDNDRGTPGVALADGECLSLVIAGGDRTGDCLGEVASITYPDDTVMFVFSAGSLKVGFSGEGGQVRGIDALTAELPVAFVTVGEVDGDMSVKPAEGTCRFTDPYRDVPATVECSAVADGSLHAGRFLTDGRRPRSN